MSKLELIPRLAVLTACAICLGATLSLSGCEGSATQTTSGQGLYGTLVDDHGNPVPGAQLKVWPTASSPNGLPNRPETVSPITTETDSLGRYSLMNLEVGVYNVFGESNQGASSVLIPRVSYLEQAQDLGIDTLKEPGIITGQVQSEKGGLAMVFCYLQGSTYVALTDSSGAFRLERIPEGTYKLNYVSEGYASAIESPVAVVSGAITTLPPRTLIHEVAFGPRSPEITLAEYDTLTGLLSIAWHPVLNEKVAGYTLEYFPTGHPELGFSSRIRQIHDTAISSYLPRFFFGQVYRPGEDAFPLSFKMPRPQMMDNPVILELAEGNLDTTLCRDTLQFVIGFQKPVTADYDVNWYKGFQKKPLIENLISGGPWNDGHIFPSRGQGHLDTLKWSKREIWENRQINYSGTDSISMDTGSVAIIVKMEGWRKEDQRRIDFGVDSLDCYRLHKAYRPKAQGEQKYWWLGFDANQYSYDLTLRPAL